MTQTTHFGRMAAADAGAQEGTGSPTLVAATGPQLHVWAAAMEPASIDSQVDAVVLRLQGRLDVKALHAALNDLVARHDALRIRFSADGRSMWVTPQATLDLLVEVTDDGTAEASVELVQRGQEAATLPFDVQHDVLLRARLLELGDDRHLVWLAAHRLACDRHSLVQLAADLGQLYGLRTESGQDELAVAPSFIAHASVIADGCDYRAGPAPATPPLPITLLPADRPRGRHPDPALAHSRRTLRPHRAAEIAVFASTRGVPLHALLVAGMALLAGRLTGQRTLALVLRDIRLAGLPEGLVGPCSEEFALSLTLDPEQVFTDWLGEVAGLLRSGTAATSSGPAPALSLAIIDGLDGCAGVFGTLASECELLPHRRSSGELALEWVLGASPHFDCHFQRSLFDGATIDFWLDALEHVLVAAARAPEGMLVGAFSVISDAMRAVLDGLQPALRPLPGSGWIHREIDAACTQHAARLALRCVDGSLDYAALAARSNQLARALHARGVGAGMRVGLCLERGRDLLPAMLAILKCGAAYVPLDPAFPLDRLGFMVRDAALGMLVTNARQLRRTPLPHTPRLLLDDDAAKIAACTTSSFDAVAARDPGATAAYVIYTSGSTGTPKGVVIAHAAVVNFLHAMAARPGMSDRDRLLAVTTLSFDIAVLELLLPLLVGAEIVLASREQAADGRELRRLLEGHAINTLQATPSTWRMMLDAGFRPPIGFRALCGGEALPTDLARRLGADGVELWNLYGPTETTVWSTCWRVQPRDRGISIGRPIRNTHVRVLDEQGQQCPIGASGEICIGGDGVALGYLDRPELTRERFVPDPFLPARADGSPRTLYRTGDRGRWCSDGRLEHQGRFDQQVKLRGYRIELGEIEARVGALDGVSRCLVLVREDRPGDPRLVAYVTPIASLAFDIPRARPELRRFLPEYMIPQHFIVLDAIPTLPNGKTDRAALPPPLAGASATRHTCDSMEVKVRALMADVLGRPVTGCTDDFFELGGHSLLAAQLIARINRECGIALTVRSVFDAPTVQSLAVLVRAAPRRRPQPRLDPIPADQARRSAPLSRDQSRIWLLQSLDPDSVAYQSPTAHRLYGTLDSAAFERAFRSLLHRQCSLTTSIGHAQDGQLLQFINDTDRWAKIGAMPSLFPAEDLCRRPEREREAELQRRMQRMIAAPFELGRGPLVRARMYRLDEQEHVLLLVAHHLIWDAGSVDVLVGDLAALYAAAVAHAEPELAPLAITYADYAIWHARWLRGPAYEEQRGFWHTRLAGRPLAIPLPADRPRHRRIGGTVKTVSLQIPGWLSESLHRVARDGRTNIQAVLLAAYTLLLARWTGQGEVVVAILVRSQNHEQIRPLIGQLTKLLPLSITVHAEQDFVSLLRQVRDVMVECSGRSDIQLEDLLTGPDAAADALPPTAQLNAGEASAAGRCLYQALFSFQDTRQWPRQWGDLCHTLVPVSAQETTADLALHLSEHPDGIAATVEFNADHFERTTATLFRDQFLALIAQVAERPGDRVRRLSQPAPFERDRLASWGHGRNLPETGADSLIARFQRICASQPDTPAVVMGTQRTRYGDLACAVDLAAARLREQIQPGDLVAIALPHGAPRLAAILGCLAAGGECLLLNPQPPTLAMADEMFTLARKRAGRHWLVFNPALERGWRWPMRSSIDNGRLQQPGGHHAPPSALPGAAQLWLPHEEEAGRLSLVSVSERVLLSLESGLREHQVLRDGARVAALAAESSPRSLIETLLPLLAGASVIVDPARRTLSAWLASDSVDTVIADAEAWERAFESGWRGRDGLTTVADGTARALAVQPDASQLQGRHLHALGDPRAGIWSILGCAGSVAHALPGRRLRILDALGELCAIGVYGDLRLGIGGPLDAAYAEVLVGRARWRADGSIEFRREPPSIALGSARIAAGSGTSRIPQSPLQALLHDLWSEALGHNDFSIDDSFFDLGGYSLIAVQMFHQAERRTGINLPLATLYRAPTIAALAAAFAAAGSRVSDTTMRPRTIPPAENAWRPLVPIRPAGRQRPLFLMHAVGGNVMNYRVLVQGLPPDLPVFGLQAVGLDGITAPLESVPAMAERYLQEIRTVQPRGPYRLGGGSMGGVIAFEIARQLSAGGERVELVAMFDTEMPQWRDETSARVRDRSLPARMRQALSMPLRPLLQRATASAASRWRLMVDSAHVLSARLLHRPLSHALRYRYLERASLRAYRAYTPGPYEGAVTLFLASDGRAGRDFDSTLGWGAVLGARVRVVPVGGSHDGIVERPALAAALTAAIDACVVRADGALPPPRRQP